MAKINKEKEVSLTQERLKEVLEYVPETGVFIWIKKTHHKVSKIKVGQVAGTVTVQGYVHITIDGYIYRAHRLVWLYVYGCFPDTEDKCFVDHIDQNRSNNRVANLRVVSGSENMRNQKMHSTNTSGFFGVDRIIIPNNSKKNPRTNYYWRSSWYDENGKSWSKKFNIETYGENGAKQMAIDYRAEQLRLLELNFGITYSERHGT